MEKGCRTQSDFHFSQHARAPQRRYVSLTLYLGLSATLTPLLSPLTSHATLQTWSATSGTGTNNSFTAGGATVGDDTATQGATASTGTGSKILTVPLAASSPTGDQGPY